MNSSSRDTLLARRYASHANGFANSFPTTQRGSPTAASRTRWLKSNHSPGPAGIPREGKLVSFKGVVQIREAFQPLIALRGENDAAWRKVLYEYLLDAIAIHQVADRPDRYEPRRKRRRPKPYDRLMKPRWQAKRDMRKGLREN